MTIPAPYISRSPDREFLTAFAAALEQPQPSPVLFHAWGVGGVGKSTLLKKLREAHPADRVAIAAVDFSYWEGSQTAIALMKKLHEAFKPQFPLPPLLRRDISRLKSEPDPFTLLDEQYFSTLNQLQTESSDGKGTASSDQIALVRRLTSAGAGFLGSVMSAGTLNPEVSRRVGEGIVDVATVALSEADRIRQLLQQHQATGKKQELQELMLEPLPKLTGAFVESLIQWSRQRPLMLVLDTYEKSLPDIDTWLWRSLLGNHEALQSHPVRLVVVGRDRLLNVEGWRKLQQDRSLVYERSLSRFDLPQTQAYLAELNIVEPEQIRQIYQITKGLPYYLNWIRAQQAAGRVINFSEGNQEIVTLLVQGLNDTQKEVIEIAACCLRFNERLMRELLGYQHDFDTAVDAQLNCFEWLTQKTFFVEPIGADYRLDDVARDVFRRSFWQADEDGFHQIHRLLADHYLSRSDQAVSSDSPPPARYNNPDWREPRAEFLYYQLLSRRDNSPQEFLTHLLEARYFNQGEMVKTPFQAVLTELNDPNYRPLPHTLQQFLQQVKPAVEHSWAVLEQDPIDYEWNQTKYGLSKTDTDQAIEICLAPQQINALEGLAKFAALFYKANRCVETQQLDWLTQAKTQAEQIATDDDPEFSSGLFLWKIGNALADLGQYQDEIDSYNKALEHKPDDHDAWYNRGIALRKLGQYQDAIDSCDKALEHKPDYHEAWNNRGVALKNLGQYQAAIDSCDKALEHKPDYHEAWNNRANALSELKRYKEAIDSYDKALEHKPNYHEAWYNRGVGLHELKRYKEAIDSYDQTLEHKPDYHQAWFNRSVDLVELGQFQEAIDSYDKALEHKPDNHQAWFNRANLLKKLKQYQAAIDSYDKSLEFLPDDAGAYYNKACCYGLQQNVEAAIENLQQAINLDSKYREWAKTDSNFDAIRGDERFQALMDEG